MESYQSPHIETNRQKAILHAAEKLFIEKGYHAVSIEQIADIAGVSKGLIHYHFTSKEQLLFCILRDMLAKLSCSLDDILKSTEKAKDKIRMAIKVYLNLASSRLELARITLYEEVFSEEIKKQLVTLMEENVLKLAELVNDGTSKGEFKPVNSRLVANLVRGAILEVIGEAALQQREIRTDEFADGIVEILCDGITC